MLQEICFEKKLEKSFAKQAEKGYATVYSR
jgi:hypothetical protein